EDALAAIADLVARAALGAAAGRAHAVAADLARLARHAGAAGHARAVPAQLAVRAIGVRAQVGHARGLAADLALGAQRQVVAVVGHAHAVGRPAHPIARARRDGLAHGQAGALLAHEALAVFAVRAVDVEAGIRDAEVIHADLARRAREL